MTTPLSDLSDFCEVYIAPDTIFLVSGNQLIPGSGIPCKEDAFVTRDHVFKVEILGTLSQSEYLDRLNRIEEYCGVFVPGMSLFFPGAGLGPLRDDLAPGDYIIGQIRCNGQNYMEVRKSLSGEDILRYDAVVVGPVTHFLLDDGTAVR